MHAANKVFDFLYSTHFSLSDHCRIFNVIASVILWYNLSLWVQPTTLVKSPWNTRRKSLTQLPVTSYTATKSMLSLTCTKIFSPTATLSRGEGGWTPFLHGTWNLLIKLDSVPTFVQDSIYNTHACTNDHGQITERLSYIIAPRSLKKPFNLIINNKYIQYNWRIITDVEYIYRDFRAS